MVMQASKMCISVDWAVNALSGGKKDMPLWVVLDGPTS